MNNDEWYSDIDDKIIKPIGRKAIDKYGIDFLKEESISKDIKIDGYEVSMIKNPILKNNFFLQMFSYAKEAEYMINVEIKVNTRTHVGLYYRMKDGIWKEETSNGVLTTY